MRLLIFILVFALSQSEARAQSEDVDPRIKEAYQIIDAIKDTNPPDAFRIEYRQGLMQVFSNSIDAVELNRLKSIPFIGIETVTRISNDLGLEARGYYARNFLFEHEASSPNKDDAFQYSYDAGPRYRFILDPTQIDDYVAIKLLYHNTTNNFKLADSRYVFMKQYNGIVLGVERSIPVTTKIGILASLDLNYITRATTDSTAELETTGIGFMMRGAAHYRVNWFGLTSRIGGAYWQGGFVNRFSPSASSTTDADSDAYGKTSHVQTFRAVSVSYTVHF